MRQDTAQQRWAILMKIANIVQSGGELVHSLLLNKISREYFNVETGKLDKEKERLYKLHDSLK